MYFSLANVNKIIYFYRRKLELKYFKNCLNYLNVLSLWYTCRFRKTFVLKRFLIINFFYSLEWINCKRNNLLIVLVGIWYSWFCRLAACSNSSSGSSEASKEINVYVDKGYKSSVEEAAKLLKESGAEVKIKTEMPLVDWITFLITTQKLQTCRHRPCNDGQLAEVTLNKDKATLMNNWGTLSQTVVKFTVHPPHRNFGSYYNKKSCKAKLQKHLLIFENLQRQQVRFC